MENPDLLQHGVDRGIITTEQRDALLALTSPAEAPREASREASRTFNGVTIAYGVGAFVVLFSFGWFLVDRWKVLGDAGLFGLAVAYAAVFLVVAQVLHREGFATARGVAVLLAVAMVPLAMRALLRWSGLWTPQLDLICSMPVRPFSACQGEPLAIELATVAAALIALRTMPFPPLMLPIAVVLVTLPERMMRDWVPSDSNGVAVGWRFMVVASLVATAAYVIDRRRRDGDYGFWLWIAASISALVAGVNLFAADASLRHAFLPASLVVLAGAVILRRRVLAVLGIIALFGYLAWLANDVFKLTLAFPLLLAALGVAIIIVTVWLQRRFPEIVRRLGGDASQPPRFPGGVAALLAPALMGVLLMQDARTIDRERRADARSRAHANASEMRARRDSIALRRTQRRP